MTRSVWILMGLGLCACGAPAAPSERAPQEARSQEARSQEARSQEAQPQEARPEQAQSQQARSQGACGEPIAGADSLLVPGALVMIGELHGTQEIPAFVGDLACLAASRGVAVRLGVE